MGPVMNVVLRRKICLISSHVGKQREYVPNVLYIAARKYRKEVYHLPPTLLCNLHILFVVYSY